MEKNKQIFVAYKGGEVSPSQIRDKLVQWCDQNDVRHSKIKALVNIDVSMFKINLTSLEEKEPFFLIIIKLALLVVMINYL